MPLLLANARSTRTYTSPRLVKGAGHVEGRGCGIGRGKKLGGGGVGGVQSPRADRLRAAAAGSGEDSRDQNLQKGQPERHV